MRARPGAHSARLNSMITAVVPRLTGRISKREADAEHAMDAAGEPDLDHESDQRQVDRDLREERRDRVGVGGALGFGGRHVQLLLDDRGADRRKRDHHRDDLQMARRPEQPRSLRAPLVPFSSPVLRRVARAGRFFAPQHKQHDRDADAP